MLPMQGVQVPSPVRELRSHILRGAAQKKKKTEKKMGIVSAIGMEVLGSGPGRLIKVTFMKCRV